MWSLFSFFSFTLKITNMSDFQQKAFKHLGLDSTNPNFSITDSDIYDLSNIQAGYDICQKEYEEKLRWIPVEENLPKYYGDPFYILVKDKNNEPNLVYIEEHSDIEDIIGYFTHWRSFL